MVLLSRTADFDVSINAINIMATQLLSLYPVCRNTTCVLIQPHYNSHFPMAIRTVNKPPSPGHCQL